MIDPKKITYFGETDSRNKRVVFGIKEEDRTKHVYVIGKTGMGKSTLLENMAIQDIQNGNGVAFVDPHGGTAEKLLEYVPEHRKKDVLYFAPFDIDHPVSFNLMEDIGPDSRHLVTSGLMSAFKKLFGEESFSDRMQYILQNTILALLEYPGATMLGINKMLIDKKYRDKVIANITDSSVKAYWTQEYAGYTERFAAEAIPAIQNKIGQFTSNPLIRNIIGQNKSTFDIRKIMDEKKIIIVNLSKGRVGEGNASLLGSMLVTKIYLAAMSRADKSAVELAKLPQFYLYVDEFQSFANESFADILSEARKYKLNLTIAHQYIEQMDEEVRDAVFGNVGTMITFRVGAYDAETLEKEFAPVFIAEDLVNLGIYQIYLKLMIDGVSSTPFSATTINPAAATNFIKKPEINIVPEILDNSRKQFATPRPKVEKDISDWLNEGVVEKLPKPAPSERRSQTAREMTGQGEKRAPQAIDTRGLEANKSVSHDRRGEVGSDRRTPPSSTRREYKPDPLMNEEKKQKRENMETLAADDFKPLKALSLDELKQKSSNQREPSPKNISDLKNVLSSIVKTPTPVATNIPAPAHKPVVEKKVSEVSEADLLALLNVEN